MSVYSRRLSEHEDIHVGTSTAEVHQVSAEYRTAK